MQFEHFALNVPDPVRMAEWYETNLGMKTALSLDHEPHTRFLADATGRVIMELYSNKAAPVPDYGCLHHLNFHCAFAVSDARTTKERLMAAGASLVEEIRPADGSLLYMLRDPWGVPLQVCQRAKPFAGQP